MPANEERSNLLGSPSLISGFQSFLFQSKPKFSRERVTTVTPSNSAKECSASVRKNNTCEKTPTRLNIDIEIPETPESQRNNNFIQPESGSPYDSSTPSSLSLRSTLETCSPVFVQKLSGYKHKILSSSESSTISLGSLLNNSSDVKDKTKENSMDDYEIFCDKERRLRQLLARCPDADIMEAQDILVSCDWNLENAVKKVEEMPPKSKKKGSSSNNNDASARKGVLYNSDISSHNVSSSMDLKSSEDEVVILSDDSDVSFNAVSSVNSVNNGISSGSKMPVVTSSVSFAENDSMSKKKKRRRIQCIDDSDDDDDDVANDNDNSYNYANSYSSSATVPKKRNSEFSVLDFKPQTSTSLDSNFQLSRNRSPGKTYSKISLNDQAFHRTTDSSVFSNDVQDPCFIPAVSRRRNAPKTKQTKKRRRKFDVEEEDNDDDYVTLEVYNSEDSDVDESLTPARNKVLTFFQTAVEEELSTIPGCSKKKAEQIMKYRPYASWADLVQKLDSEKGLSTDLLNGAKKVLDMRTAVTRLMNKCKKIALQMEDLVEALKENKEDSRDYVSKQPSLLNPEMHLTPYQMLGLNWLLLMHNQEVNGILADEMGLGKTVQAIAFLSYLKEQELPGPHLIVVPSSTLDNWQNELELWWPSASVLCYHGSQEYRRELRLQIINYEVEEFDVMVSTYNMVTSSAEDKNFFKKLDFHYVIFDEAHMLKNMASQRYQHLMRIKASRRLLLTGTPLQNNLVELMSLLIFAMPHMFSGKTEQIKLMFSAVCKKDDNKTNFEKERIEHAKRIMKPFVLRRLKSEVLKDLPVKHEEIRYIPMTEKQQELYVKTVADLSEEMRKNKEKDINSSGAGMMMQLRKTANHPLLVRYNFTDDKLLEMAKLMLTEPTHCEANVDYVYEDMCVMSDFELHKMCKQYESLKSYCLDDEKVLDSGKFFVLKEMLPRLINEGHRILLFSQFTLMLNVVEEFLNILNYKFLRLDGQIPVHERQDLIDEFQKNLDIPIFLLSTRAGGLGINLTAADTVLIHDLDFNPYNDKQAEDRCHRVGQTKDVFVSRFVSKDTIEEGILKRAQDKLRLERDITSANDDEEENSVSVAALLKDALGISTTKS